MGSILSGFFRRDGAESFIWSDGSFEEVVFVEEEKMLVVRFRDYADTLVTFTFSSVSALVVNDPVYCVGSHHSRHEGGREINLHDDDDVVLSFVYEDVLVESE